MRGEEEGLKSLSRYIFPSQPSPLTMIKPSSGFEFSRRQQARCENSILQLRENSSDFFPSKKTSSLQQLLEAAALTWSPLNPRQDSANAR